MLEELVALEEIETPLQGSSPMLLVGAVDVCSGEFRAFNSRRDTIGAKTILASTALPTLFRVVRADGGVYWDGLFSQNRPVRELTGAKPDEIWVIQIDPERREGEPKSMVDILDRRNELASNLSLYQEIPFIEKINDLVDKLGDGESPEDKRLRIPGEEGKEYRPIGVRRIEMLKALDFASKLDRSPSFIGGLMDYGEERAEEFLRA
jgi:NTE family protein